MGRNQKQVRQSQKVKKKAKRFISRNPQFVAALTLPDSILKNCWKFMKIVLKLLSEKNNLKGLLNVSPDHPFSVYQLVPFITQLLKQRTTFISSKISISYLEKLHFESPSVKLLSFFPSHDSNPMEPRVLLLCTNPFPATAIWCVELKPYFEAIVATYRLRTNFEYRKLPIPTFQLMTLNPRNAVTFLSMGKESLWSLSITIQNKCYQKIVVIFVNNSSFGGSYREKRKFDEFSEWFKLNEIDERVQFNQLQYEHNLIGIQKREQNIKINGMNIKEPLCKLQYLQLLSVPLIRINQCGTFIIPQDFNESNYNNASYFGDHPLSFISFNSFYCKYVGGSIKLLFQGLDISRADKVLQLIKLNWFQFNSSCYMNWNFFEERQKRTRINPALSMCGECWKCKIDLKLFRENTQLSKLIKLTSI